MSAEPWMPSLSGDRGFDRHDAADGAAVGGRKTAGIEVDAIEELGVEHRRPAQEVIDEGNPMAVDEHPAVVGVGAADQQETGDKRCAGQTGQRLNDPNGIAEGARHRGELAPLERAAGDFENLALALDHGFVRATALAAQPQSDLYLFVFLLDGQGPLEGGVALGHGDDRVLAGRHAVHVEAPVFVGDRVETELANRYDDAR